jgi:hypothetical protein
MATGGEKLTCCQPDPVSLEKVAVASRVPVLDHKLPMCVPVFAALLKKRRPVMVPSLSERNFTANSTGDPGPASTTRGAALLLQIVQGQFTP